MKTKTFNRVGKVIQITLLSVSAAWAAMMASEVIRGPEALRAQFNEHLNLSEDWQLRRSAQEPLPGNSTEDAFEPSQN